MSLFNFLTNTMIIYVNIWQHNAIISLACIVNKQICRTLYVSLVLSELQLHLLFVPLHFWIRGNSWSFSSSINSLIGFVMWALCDWYPTYNVGKNTVCFNQQAHRLPITQTNLKLSCRYFFKALMLSSHISLRKWSRTYFSCLSHCLGGYIIQVLNLLLSSFSVFFVF